MSATDKKMTTTKKFPVLKTLEKGKKQELVKVFKAIAKKANVQVKIASKEAAKQAKIEAKAAEKQAKIDAKEAAKQAKIDAKAAEKQAKIAAKEAETQARFIAKKFAKEESKLLRKINRCKKVEVYEENRSFTMNWSEYVSGIIVTDKVMEAARLKHEETKEVV